MSVSTEFFRKSFEAPDETRPFPNGHVDVVTIGDHVIGRATFQPGWRWSESVKPIAGTESCQSAHMGYVIAGRMGIRMDDGRELEFGRGDAMLVDPGHDAWVVGDEDCVIVDYAGFKDYAKPHK